MQVVLWNIFAILYEWLRFIAQPTLMKRLNLYKMANS